MRHYNFIVIPEYQRIDFCTCNNLMQMNNLIYAYGSRTKHIRINVHMMRYWRNDKLHVTHVASNVQSDVGGDTFTHFYVHLRTWESTLASFGSYPTVWTIFYINFDEKSSPIEWEWSRHSELRKSGWMHIRVNSKNKFWCWYKVPWQDT